MVHCSDAPSQQDTKGSTASHGLYLLMFISALFVVFILLQKGKWIRNKYFFKIGFEVPPFYWGQCVWIAVHMIDNVLPRSECTRAQKFLAVMCCLSSTPTGIRSLTDGGARDNI